MMNRSASLTTPGMMALRRRQAASPVALDDRYWRHAPVVAAIMIATIGMRVHELVPYLSVLRPITLVIFAGGLLLLVNAPPGAIPTALRDRTARLTIVYFAWMLVTAPFALWVRKAVETAQLGVSLSIMTVGILLCAPDRRIVRYLSTTFAVSAGLLAALSIAFGVTGMSEGIDRLGTGASLDPNDLAAVMALGFPFAVAAALRMRRWRRLVAFATAALLAAVVVRTGSRGGTIALGVGALVFVYGVGGKRRWILFTALIASAVAGWFLSPPAFRERMIGLSSLDQDYNYTEYGGRKQIWARARGYFVEHPLTGVGAGNFGVAEGETAMQLGVRSVWAAAHNAYLQAFAELGAPGGIIFIALLLTSLIRAFPLWRGMRGDITRGSPELFSALCAFATSSYFLSHAYFFTFFALCALTALADRARRLDSPGAAGARTLTLRRTGRGHAPPSRRTPHA